MKKPINAKVEEFTRILCQRRYVSNIQREPLRKKYMDLTFGSSRSGKSVVRTDETAPLLIDPHGETSRKILEYFRNEY